MSIEDIILRGVDREATLWNPIADTFISMLDIEQRTILFGLYSNGFQNGFIYLQEISSEKLLQIIAQYDSNMSQLDSDQQKTVLEVASKRYLDSLDQMIHEQKMEELSSKIDATDKEFDAKFEALEADRQAIETLQVKALKAIEETTAKIAILESRIAEEAVNRSEVEISVLEKALSVKKVSLQIIEAGVKGLNIQLEIQNAAVQNLDLAVEKHNYQQQADQVPANLKDMEAEGINIDAEVYKSGTTRSLLDADVAELGIRTVKTEIDIESKEIDTKLLEVDIAKALYKTSEIDVDIKEILAKTEREKAKRIDLETDTALVDVRIADLELDVKNVAIQLSGIEVDIAMLDIKILQTNLIKIDKTIAQIRKDTMAYEIPNKKQAQLDTIVKDVEILKTRITASNEYQTIEKNMQLSRIDKQVAEHNFKMSMTAMDEEFSIHKADIKIESYSKDIEIATDQKKYKQDEDDEQKRVPESQIDSAQTAQSAAIDAAETMATANIVNSLTHQIGAA